eukprot:1543551-Amphidinium_carterae.1
MTHWAKELNKPDNKMWLLDMSASSIHRGWRRRDFQIVTRCQYAGHLSEAINRSAIKPPTKHAITSVMDVMTTMTRADPSQHLKQYLAQIGN